MVFTSSWSPRPDGGPPIVWHPEYSVPWPQSHRFAMWKFEDLQREVVEQRLASPEELFLPSEAAREDIARAHDPGYVDAFESDSLPHELWRRVGFTQRPDHAALVRRTRLEVGGTLLAAEMARATGLACNLGGGTHHAHRGYGAGYTVYNDLAITALAHAGRSLVVDVDVHQGDGTAEILGEESRAFTFSVHCEANFPFGFVGMDHLGHDRSDLDVPLPAGAGDQELLDALHTHLPATLDSHRPTLVLYDAGVDTDAVDGLGRLVCSPRGTFLRDQYVLEQCVLRNIPVATVIGGGYDRDRSRLARRHAIILHAATVVWRKFFPMLKKR